MRLIDKFYCIQSERYGDGSTKIIAEEIVSVKQELKRPMISLIGKGDGITSHKNRRFFRKTLSANPNSYESFSEKELLFLSEIYKFDVAEHDIYKGYFSSVLKIHPLYQSPADLIFIEEDEKKYLRIEFHRWELENQPRSAGEDSLGENITYVLGFWENPLLTDEIIAKIKK
ncbi:hypothetical protein C8C83_5082 [Flavobacterium sp. 90]|uniref:hypothetical protein n=1 Tax=unclassified Flavobacterium TaxID=196869 RepID=UPI000EB555D2|nr:MULTISPECIES: hypothetical protein [unclassified Flavobacterium]RKR05732.1 hypothetical protein C8C82_5428 [Flavobacterium sp. 81]TCK57043.1 hypothetical protein C8C83_5082 [Flavobacterium sp. 90]